jgi:hypothetical protein
MATSFGHNGHHQTISRKLIKAGIYSAKSSVYMGSHLHLYQYLFIESVKIINGLKMCYLQYDVSKFCCGGREYI